MVSEIELANLAQEMGLEFAKLSVEDRKSARTMQSISGSWVPGFSPDTVCNSNHEPSLVYDQLIKEFATPEGGGWTHVSIPNQTEGVPRTKALVIDKQGTRLMSSP
jgi:hypothetical protein